MNGKNIEAYLYSNNIVSLNSTEVDCDDLAVLIVFIRNYTTLEALDLKVENFETPMHNLIELMGFSHSDLLNQDLTRIEVKELDINHLEALEKQHISNQNIYINWKIFQQYIIQ